MFSEQLQSSWSGFEGPSEAPGRLYPHFGGPVKRLQEGVGGLPAVLEACGGGYRRGREQHTPLHPCPGVGGYNVNSLGRILVSL